MTKKLTPSKFFLQILKTLSLFSLSICLPAKAVDFTWISNVSMDWNTVTNWNPLGIPGAADNAHVGTGLQNVLIINAADAVNQLDFNSVTSTSYAVAIIDSLTIGSGGVTNNTFPLIRGVIQNNGTLNLNNASVGGNPVGANPILILNSGVLNFLGAGTSTCAGLISGTGTVFQLGTGTTILTADNTYTGLTTISSGALQLGNGGTTGSVVGNIQDNTLLQINRSNTYTYNGIISGSGGLRQLGTGTTILTGDNTYTGGTTIGAGILQLGNGGTTGSVVGNIQDNTLLQINRSNTYTYNGIISGLGGLTQLGTGTLILNGVNTYIGNTNINAGTLELGDAAHPTAQIAGSVFVNAGGQLSGYGTIGAGLVNGTLANAGVVRPGANGAIGTITVSSPAGSYTQASTGSYIVEVDRAGNSDLLRITTGTASLNGMIGIDAVENGFLPNFPYTILTAGGGVLGTFSNAPGGPSGMFNQGFLKGTVLYFPNMVQLEINFNGPAFLQAVATPNQQSVANYLLTFGATPAIQELIASITTAEQFQAAMDQISGATFANDDVAITRVGNWFSGALADRFDVFPSANCNTSLLQPDNEASLDQKNQFWAAVHGAEENISSGQVSGLNTATGNFALGYEWGVAENGKMGVAIGGSQFSTDAQTREMGGVTGSLYQLGLYGRSQMGPWLFGIEFDAGVTNEISTERRIQGASSVATTKGNYKARLYSEQARAAYDLTETMPLRFSPFLGLIAQQLNRDDFTENTNTGFELNVAGSTYHSTRSQLGALLEVPTTSSFKPFASLDWEHEFADQNGTVNASLVGVGGSFSVQGQTIGRDSAVLKVGTVLFCGNGWNVSALYQGWYGSGWQENGGTLEASVVLG